VELVARFNPPSVVEIAWIQTVFFFPAPEADLITYRNFTPTIPRSWPPRIDLVVNPEVPKDRLSNAGAEKSLERRLRIDSDPLHLGL
jgi:hypothetical protein